MYVRIILCLLLFGLNTHAQTVAVVVPMPAQRYLDILTKRPQPGTIFERFYAAWLEGSSVTELGNYLEARTKLPKATAGDHLLLAVFHAHRGDDRAALAAYEEALKLDPANARAWIERSRLEARALDFAAALLSLDDAVKAKPDGVSTMEIGKLRGRALLRLGKNDEALRTWKELAAAHAGDEDLSEELIDLLTDEGQYEAALETAQALIKQSRDPVARTLRQLRLTDILLLAERRDEALKTLRETLAATGADSWVEGDVLGRVSRVFRMSDDVNGLEKFLAELVKENPQRVALAWEHTQLLGETGQKEAALKQARALMQSNPSRRDLQEGFLELLVSLDLIQEAVEQAQALAQQNARDKEMLVRLASLQHRAKEDAAAQSTLERFLKVEGAGEADHLRAARLLENWEEAPVQPNSPAAQSYVRLVEKFPASMNAQEAQAHYLHRVGQRDAALLIWSRLAKTAALDDLLRIAQALQARLEVRAALDLLLPREGDFAQEAHFFALLVQLGMANKELERTLPWARTRLRLVQDAEGIDTAVKDILLVLRSDETGKLASAVLQDLQSTTTPTLQNRCLHAALLENGGQSAAAEKMLNAAPAEDRLIALSQLVQLLQTRLEWEKAAQTLQQVMELPGARTTARVQRMVDFYRRAEKSEQALTWIAEWKKLSPSAVQPWLDEARLLTELNRTKEALTLLRGALRKFPDSIEAASSYATMCMENGQPDEAERTYLALYEKTTEAATRLRLIGPLALAAQQHNSLPRLIENFQQRQKQNRASAQPWLALAEIHRATSNDEERRRCLYEASRLRPQDLALLLDIAHSEEEIGLTTEALRTLESAAKLDKTGKTRENIARLQIESGDSDLGYRMLFEIAGGSAMDARAIEQMADTIAEKGEWERVTTFLEPVLEKHPKDYRLHYLNAVALEEAGREQEAVRAFLEIVGMHDELPGVLNTGRSIGLQEQYAKRKLPPGAEDWLVLPGMMQYAYAHQQKGGQHSRRGYSNGYFGQPINTGMPHGFIEHAPGVTESPVLALAHLLRIAGGWDAQERARLVPQLKLAGVSDAALLLEAAESSPQLVITPEMLAAHPQNIMLFSVWLMQPQPGDPEELLPLYENAWKLFQESDPVQAYGIAQRAWAIAGEQSGIWLKRIFDAIQSMPQADAETFYATTRMLQSQTEVVDEGNATPRLTEEEIRRIANRLLEWGRANGESFEPSAQIGAQAVAKNWDGVIEVLKKALDQVQVATLMPPTGRSMRGGRNAQNIQGLMLQPQPFYELPKVMANFAYFTSIIQGMASYREGNQKAADLPEKTRQRMQEMRDGLRPYIVKESDARLQFILRLICGEDEALEKESDAKLQAKDVTVGDYLTAAWLAQHMMKSGAAITHLSEALKLTETAEARLPLENAIFYHAQLLIQQEPDEAKSAAARTQAKVLLDAHLQTAKTDNEKLMIAQIMNGIGLSEEAQAIQEALQTIRTRRGSATRSPVAVTNPYSRNRSYNQPQRKAQKTPEQLVQEGKGDVAMKEYVRQIRAAIQQTLSVQNGTSGHQQLHQIMEQASKLKLWDEVMKVLRDSADSGWRPRLEYAVMLEHVGNSTAPALVEHRAVLAANPRAYDSQVRLAVVLAYEGKYDEAAEHWRAVPTLLQDQHLAAIVQEFTQQHQYAVVKPVALSGLLCAWLKGIDPKRVLSRNMAQQMTQALEQIQNSNGKHPSLYEPWQADPLSTERTHWKRNANGQLLLDENAIKARAEQRLAHDDLCRAMLQVPELAALAFGPLAGLTIQDDDPKKIAELETTAMDLLTRLTIPKVRHRLAALSNNGYGHVNNQNISQGFGSAQRIPMPDAALFLVLNAAQRRDAQALDETIMPLITRLQGKQRAADLKGYARLIMAQENEFADAAAQWLKQQPAHAFNNTGSAHEEVLRLWLKRKINTPLDALFLPKNSSAFGYNIPRATTAYVLALGECGPEVMRLFVRKLRSLWLGDDAEARRKGIANWLTQQNDQRRRNSYYRQPGAREQAIQSYSQWLQGMLQDRRGLALLDLAIEDGLSDSPNWLNQIANRHTELTQSQTPEDFLLTVEFIGFLGDAEHFRAYDLSENQQHNTWLGNLTRQWRERSNDEQLNSTLDKLGKLKPTFGTDLMQALLLKNSHTVLQLDGKPRPLEAAQVSQFQSRNDGDGFAYRGAALQIVLTRHAQEIASMSTISQHELSLVLRDELRGYPEPDRLGEKLTQVLAPLLKAEKTELIHKIDQIIAAKTWSDLGQQEYQFNQQFPVLMADAVRIDPVKADAAARHAFELLRASPEQQQAGLKKSRETPITRLLQAISQVPQLLHLTLDLAEQEGLTQSRSWKTNLGYHLDSALRDSANIPFIFTGMPWVAEAPVFRDPKLDNQSEPTLLAHLINQVESQENLRSAVHDHLAKQPATFGTELLLAFLQRAPGDSKHVRSFYNKRPDDAAILAFIQKRHGEFARLQPESAANLLAMLNARMPDLDQKSDQDAALKQTLQQLTNATAAQFEADINRWMEMTSLPASGREIYEDIENCVPLLDHLAQIDKPRAVAFLDQISKLIAQKDAINSRGGSRQPPHQIEVGQWLQKAAFVPELFGESMQRAEESGAARDPDWLSYTLSRASNLYNHRGKPQRVIALLESAGMLDPAATFNPRPMPRAAERLKQMQSQMKTRGMSEQSSAPTVPQTLLETWSQELSGGRSHPGLAESLQKRQPRSFGTDLLLLMCSSKSSADVTVFAEAHAEEIAAVSAKQKKMLSALFVRQHWEAVMAPLIPALREDFAAPIQEQAAKYLVFIEALMKTTKWEEIEGLYYNTLQTSGPGNPPNGMPSSFAMMPRRPGFYQPGQSNPAIDHLAQQLSQLAMLSPDKARQGLRHVTSVYHSQFRSDEYDPFRKPAVDPLFKALCASPPLAAIAIKFAASTHDHSPFSRGVPWTEDGLIDLALPAATLASAENITSVLGQMGMCVSAAEFDPVLLTNFKKYSFLEMVALKLSAQNAPLRQQISMRLAQKSNMSFGSTLLVALLSTPDAGTHESLARCAAHFSQVRKESAGAILHAFYSTLPALGKIEHPEEAVDDLACFAPLFQLRDAEEHAYLEAVMAQKPGLAEPCRGRAFVVLQEITRLMKAAKADKAVNLVRALRSQLEPQNAAEFFGKGRYRRDGEKLSDFLRQPKVHAGQETAVIACLFQAAARLPEVRMMPEGMRPQTFIYGSEVVFAEWERRGGHAAPAAAFDALVQEVAKLIPLDNTAGLWLPQLHDALTRMGPQELRELTDWTAKQSTGSLKVVVEEFKLAKTLIDVTQPLTAEPHSTRLLLPGSPKSEKVFAATAKETATLLRNEKILPHVRLALAAFLTSTYPGLLDEETRQHWGAAAARAWHEGRPITRSELETLLNGTAVLPMTATWWRTCDLVLQRWQQREAIMEVGKIRYIENDQYPFLMRFAARSENEPMLTKLLKQGNDDIRLTTGILLESSDWRHACEDRLRTAYHSLPSFFREARGWLPPTAEQVKAMQSAPLEDALLAEVLALDTNDDATRMLYPQQSWPSRDQRFETFAKKLSFTPLPTQAMERAETLVKLGLEHTPAALALLPQFDAVSKVIMADSIKENRSGLRLWTDFLALHAALKMAGGDYATADSHLQRLKTDPFVVKKQGSSTESIESEFRHTLFFCLVQLWRAGMAREPAKIARLLVLNHVSQESYYSRFPVPVLKFALEAWQSVLKNESPPPIDSTAKLQNRTEQHLIIALTAAIGGAGKQRLTFQQRLQFYARLLGQSSLLEYVPATVDLLTQQHYFDKEELLKQRDSVVTATQMLPSEHLSALASFMRRHDALGTAATLWEMAAKQTSRSSSAPNRYRLNRASTLMRLKKFDEARECLGELDEKDSLPANLQQRDALIKLMP
jgi:predicted Zn-dependent protease